MNKSHSLVDTLLRSDFYHGEYREVLDYCEAYMTKEEHQELRQIARNRLRFHSDDKKYFLFTGLCICPECGLKMESQSQVQKSGHRYHYYRCYAPYRTGLCSFKGNINERYIESYLIDNIQSILEDYSEEIQKEQKSNSSKKKDT